MRAPKFSIVLALLLVFGHPTSAEPKAYELIKYRGKAEGLTVAFDFAAGYPEASEVRMKEGRRGKTTRFVLMKEDEMRFVPEKDRAGGKEVTIEMSPDDGSGDKVNGIYRAGGKTIRFTLTAQKAWPCGIAANDRISIPHPFGFATRIPALTRSASSGHVAPLPAGSIPGFQI